jgi:hypothetical protein
MSHFHEIRALISKLIHEPFSWISANPAFRGCKVFPNSLTLAPRGSGLTPTIWFHENFWILVKNVTLGTSELTLVIWISRNGHTEAVSWNCPPAPINREACAVKNFHRFLTFFESLQGFSQSCSSRQAGLSSSFPKFSKVLFSSFFCFVLSYSNIPFRIFCFVRVVLGFVLVLLSTRWPALKAPLESWLQKSWSLLVFLRLFFSVDWRRKARERHRGAGVFFWRWG